MHKWQKWHIQNIQTPTISHHRPSPSAAMAPGRPEHCFEAGLSAISLGFRGKDRMNPERCGCNQEIPTKTNLYKDLRWFQYRMFIFKNRSKYKNWDIANKIWGELSKHIQIWSHAKLPLQRCKASVTRKRQTNKHFSIISVQSFFTDLFFGGVGIF